MRIKKYWTSLLELRGCEGLRLDTEIAAPRFGVTCRGTQGDMTVMAAVATLNPRTCVAPYVLEGIGAQMVTMRTMITAGGAALFPIYSVVVRLGMEEREIEVVSHELMRHPMVLGTDLVRVVCGTIAMR